MSRYVLFSILLSACDPPEITPTDSDADTDTDTGPSRVLPLAPASPVENGDFSTADTCSACHANASSSDSMEDDVGRPVSPFELWQSSMMANAARDPLWRAVVSVEVAATPNAALAIEQKCTSCHTPMAARSAALNSQPLPGMQVLTAGTDPTQLALDGVSCTVCHQIEADGLGTEGSFSGNFTIDGRGVLFGPYTNPFSNPMVSRSGFTPTPATHLGDSGLCATCHTLTTETLAPDGTPTGGHVVEQSPYLEWQLSDFAATTSCQDCHMPTDSEDGVPISTRIARNPNGGDFGPTSARSPYRRHLLVGGNTLIPSILRDFATELAPLAPVRALDATLAAAREQLSERTATVTLSGLARQGDSLVFDAEIQVLAGHRFPTGIPLRRAWLRSKVTDGSGAVVYESGRWDTAGRLIDASGMVLPSELPAGPIPVHVDQVRDATQVPIYEGVMADASGDPTFLLLRGEGWVKDDRLLPRGFDTVAAAALEIAPVGVAGDLDFTGGGDTVHYTLDLPGATGPFTVEVELVYQVLSARWAAEIFTANTPETNSFRTMYDASARGPERVSIATATLP